MPVVRVDDGGAGGDVVVVADVPLRHVDEVMVTETARCVGHAGEAQIGAVGKHRRQQRGFVGGGIAGAQMHESVGESGPPVDIAQDLGDPDPRQHSVQPQGPIAGGLWDGGRCAGDVSVPSSISTPSSSPRSATKVRRSCSAAVRLVT